MSKMFSRTEMLLGKDGVEKLSRAHVAVFGVGGVGGYAVEALVRAGVGKIDIIDSDDFTESNLNRQLHATSETVGRVKVDVVAERCRSINPACEVTAYKTFFTPDTSAQFDFSRYDYVLDAIDTVSGKIELCVQCDKCGTPMISSMGAGNKLDPTLLEVTDIHKTSVCPLAKAMRLELKKRGIKRLKVVYSKELPIIPVESKTDPESGRRIPGSISFVPAVAGLIMAGEVIKDLTGVRGRGIGG